MGLILNPATNQPFPDVIADLEVEVCADGIRRKLASERVTFYCPCGKRNNQSTKAAKAFPQPHVATFRCNACLRLVNVKKRAIASIKKGMA